MPRPKRKKELELHGICVVCGDKASSMKHYGSKVCFSCRAFFRRLANKGRVPERKFCNRIVNVSGECPINIKTRQLCSFCRYQKCCLYGMEPKLVMSRTEIEETRKRAQQRRENNKSKRNGKVPELPMTKYELRVKEYQEKATKDFSEMVDLSDNAQEFADVSVSTYLADHGSLSEPPKQPMECQVEYQFLSEEPTQPLTTQMESPEIGFTITDISDNLICTQPNSYPSDSSEEVTYAATTVAVDQPSLTQYSNEDENNLIDWIQNVLNT